MLSIQATRLQVKTMVSKTDTGETPRKKNVGSSARHIVFVGRRHRNILKSIPDAVVCSGRNECADQLDQQPNSLWVAFDTAMLLEAFEKLFSRSRINRRFGHLLLLGASDKDEEFELVIDRATDE